MALSVPSIYLASVTLTSVCLVCAPLSNCLCYCPFNLSSQQSPSIYLDLCPPSLSISWRCPSLCLVCEIPSPSYLCLVCNYILCLVYYPPYFVMFIFPLFIPLPPQSYCRLGKCQSLSQSIIIDADKAYKLQLEKHHCCSFFKASLLHLKMTTMMLYLFNNDALLC